MEQDAETELKEAEGEDENEVEKEASEIVDEEQNVEQENEEIVKQSEETAEETEELAEEPEVEQATEESGESVTEDTVEPAMEPKDLERQAEEVREEAEEEEQEEVVEAEDAVEQEELEAQDTEDVVEGEQIEKEAESEQIVEEAVMEVEQPDNKIVQETEGLNTEALGPTNNILLFEKDDLEKASVVAQADETEQMEELVAELGDTESDVVGAEDIDNQELDETGGGDVGDASKSETVEEVPVETMIQEVQQTSYPVVEVPDGGIEDSAINTTGMEIAQDVAEVGVSEDALKEVQVNNAEMLTPIQIDEASSSLSNGDQSSLTSPRKRKHDEVDDEEFKHVKKARLSEEFVQPPFTNGEGSAEAEDVTKEYVVINMEDVPPSESQEIIDSVPKETVQNFTNEGLINEQVTVDQTETSITQTVAPVNPVYNRVFIPNPHFSGETDTSKQFSVVSYNVLADCHLFRNDYSFTESDYLEPDYRLNKLLEEIQYLDGDVVCLQEVDPDFFNDQLLPSMKR